MGGRNMSETPKCPYCGAKMTLSACNDLDDKWYARYICNNCHSMGPFVRDYKEKNQATNAALSAALHRAEPEMRPLTQKEVEAHCEEGVAATPLWVEFKNVPEVSRWMCAEVPGYVFSIETINIFLRSCGERYGRTCRCWPRKPNPEQMAAEKWEE